MCETRRREFIVGVVCDQFDNMVSQESLSLGMRGFMADEEALWYELEHVDYQQGSSSEWNLLTSVSSNRALSQSGVGPSGRVAEVVHSKETEL